MTGLNLGVEWLPDIRRELLNNERECISLINSYSFSEKPFVDYFNEWDKYIEILMNNPTAKDLYDASNLPSIAGYYNTHTNTNNHYDENTGKKS